MTYFANHFHLEHKSFGLHTEGRKLEGKNKTQDGNKLTSPNGRLQTLPTSTPTSARPRRLNPTQLNPTRFDILGTDGSPNGFPQDSLFSHSRINDSFLKASTLPCVSSPDHPRSALTSLRGHPQDRIRIADPTNGPSRLSCPSGCPREIEYFIDKL